MKTGVIVYVVGEERLDKDYDERELINSLDIRAERVEVVFSGEDHFDVMDAWLSLTVKGMQKVICMMAEIVNHSRINLTGRELRLCG
jgi:hypothetical protein